MSTAKEPKAAEKKTGTEPLGRYETVVLAKQWLSVLMRSDECKGMGPSELVKKSLEDIQSGKVSAEEIRKAAAKVPPAPPAVEKEKKD